MVTSVSLPWVHIQNTPEEVRSSTLCIFKPNIIDGHTPHKLTDAFHARNGRNYVKDS